MIKLVRNNDTPKWSLIDLQLFYNQQGCEFIEEDEVSTCKDTVYFIHEAEFYEEDEGDYTMVPWFRDLPKIPKHIVGLANNKQLLIIYVLPEVVAITEMWKHNQIIARDCKRAGIAEHAIHFVVCSTGEESEETPLNMSYFPIYGLGYKTKIANNPDLVTEFNLAERQKKFTCLNRMGKTHRLDFVHGMCKRHHGGLSDGFLSYGNQGQLAIPEEDKGFTSLFPIKVDDLDYDQHNNHETVHQRFFNEAYWNFVTESSFRSSTSFITEKTFKPIANLQPFIIVGDYQSLERLREMGYKTFGTVINENYDQIKDPAKRMQALIDVAVGILNTPHKDLVEMMHKIKPILEHNQQLFLNFPPPEFTTRASK